MRARTFLMLGEETADALWVAYRQRQRMKQKSKSSMHRSEMGYTKLTKKFDKKAAYETGSELALSKLGL